MRQTLLCSLAVLLGTHVVIAQQFPMFKEYPQGGGAEIEAVANGYPGYYPPAVPGYPYYPTPQFPNGSVDLAVNAAGNYPYSAPPFNPADPSGYYGPCQFPQGNVGEPEPAPAIAPTGPTPPPAPEGTPPFPPEGYGAPELPDGPRLLKTEHPERPGGGKLGWVALDYQLSWMKPARLTAPLMTTGDTVNQGIIGEPGTFVLFGGSGLHTGPQSGFRGEVGLWLDKDNCCSADLGGFALFPIHKKFSVISDAEGDRLITRPTFDVVNKMESGFIVSFPGVAGGSSSVQTESDFFGIELNARCHTEIVPRLNAEVLMGYRYMRLNESLEINDKLKPLIPGFFTFQGNFIDVTDTLLDKDQFSTTNQFNGFQLGGQLRREFGPFYISDFEQAGLRFFVSGFAKAAVGFTDQTVNIKGQTTLLSPNGNQVAEGGIMALTSNIGNHNRVVFGVVPETGLNLGIEITNHFQLQAGYSLLAWNAVVRPGNQIDRGVNPGLVPSDQSFGTTSTPVRPAFAFQNEMFWVQNLYVGVEFRH